MTTPHIASSFSAGAAADLSSRRGRLALCLQEALTTVARLRANKQVATDLDLSVRTVENHLSHVYAKLDLAGRAELIVFVLHRLLRTSE